LAVAVVSTVLDADRRGRRALERLQVSQVEQLARGLDARLEASFEATEGLADLGYTFAPRDPGDLGRLQALQDFNREATTGIVLVD
jgi:hypothetical protein